MQDDSRIIAMLEQRDEQALTVIREQFGAMCYQVAYRITGSREDAEECVNDTWLRAWNAMPPAKPNRLGIFLGKITRNLAIDKYRKERSQKYGSGQAALCLDELEECIGENHSIEDRIALAELLNRFLKELPQNKRDIFLLRYWYLMPVSEIAKRCGISEGVVKKTLQRLREHLKKYLEKEGFGI